MDNKNITKFINCC